MWNRSFDDQKELDALNEQADTLAKRTIVLRRERDEAVALLRLLRERLVAIYTQANAVESGWTGPVYRDVLSSIKQEARFAIERTE